MSELRFHYMTGRDICKLYDLTISLHFLLIAGSMKQVFASQLLEVSKNNHSRLFIQRMFQRL